MIEKGWNELLNDDTKKKIVQKYGDIDFRKLEPISSEEALTKIFKGEILANMP